MKVVIDLSGLKTKDEVLRKFGEIFEFGGPDGNFPVEPEGNAGWGLNWDALTDSLALLPEGGIWGTGKKFPAGTSIEIIHFEEFRKNDPEGYVILQEILSEIS
jgi:hypothetical protein